MSSTSDLYSIPRTSANWNELRLDIYEKILVTKNAKLQFRTWSVIISLGLTGLLYILCVYRTLCLKKFYLVKRDSFRRLCPHSCLLVSLCGLGFVTISITNVTLQRIYRSEPFPIFKFVLDQSTSFAIYLLGAVRTWGIWCAMPPTVLRLRDSKVSRWRAQGPLAIFVFVMGHFLTYLITGVLMLPRVIQLQTLWYIIRSQLDQIAVQASSPKGFSVSLGTLETESQTLMLLEDLSKKVLAFWGVMRLYAGIIALFILAMLGMFSYASIVILRTLNIQWRIIKEAHTRVKLLRKSGPTSFSGHEALTSFSKSKSMRKRAQSGFPNFNRRRSSKTLAVFFRPERLDFSYLNAPMGEQSMLEQEKDIKQKASCLQRHWWRVSLQLFFVTLISISYFLLSLLIATNFWRLGNGGYFPTVQSTIDDWKIWTWITGPGTMLASINCVAEFLENEEGESEVETMSCDSQNSSEEQ